MTVVSGWEYGQRMVPRFIAKGTIQICVYRSSNVYFECPLPSFPSTRNEMKIFQIKLCFCVVVQTRFGYRETSRFVIWNRVRNVKFTRFECEMSVLFCLRSQFRLSFSACIKFESFHRFIERKCSRAVCESILGQDEWWCALPLSCLDR